MLIAAARKSIRQLIAARLTPLDLTPHHYWMLLMLLRARQMSLGELARAMWMDRPTVSRLVQEMVQRGFLSTGPDPGHGKRICILLTPEGVTLCGKLNRISGEFQGNAQKGMTPEEVGSLRELLRKYIRNLDGMIAERGFDILPLRSGLARKGAEQVLDKSGT